MLLILSPERHYLMASYNSADDEPDNRFIISTVINIQFASNFKTRLFDK